MLTFQLVFYNIIGFITSFGKNVFKYDVISFSITLLYVTSELIGKEFVRYTMIKNSKKNYVFINIILISIIYAIMDISLKKFSIISKSNIDFFKTFGSNMLPNFSANIFASIVTLIGGPFPSIVYLGGIKYYEWFMPILPDPTWAIKSLVYSITPILGCLLVFYYTPNYTLLKSGLIKKRDMNDYKNFNSDIKWYATIIISCILILGSSGLLGFKPNVIISGSMNPALNVGDITISMSTNVQNIQVGDIVQYYRSDIETPIIHRVTEIHNLGDSYTLITKGDANNAPDPPITSIKQVNKITQIIPKVGWVSIYLKSILLRGTNILTSNIKLSYLILFILILSTSIYGFIKIKRKKWFYKMSIKRGGL